MNPQANDPFSAPVGSTDQFGNKIINSNWQIAQPKAQTQTQAAPARKPGNWFTHLLPAIGGTLGSIIGTPADIISGLGGTIAGGAGGASLGKLLENKLEKQSLGSGVAGQAALGGASALGGEIIGKGLQAGGNLLSNMVGRGATEVAGEAGGQAAGDAIAQTGKATASDIGRQNIGERTMQSVRGIDPAKLPGNTVGNVGEAARINNVATDLGLRGSSTQQLTQLAPKFDATNTQLGKVLATDTVPLKSSQIVEQMQRSLQDNTMYTASPIGSETKSAMDNAVLGYQQKLAQLSKGEGDNLGITLKDLHGLRQSIGQDAFAKTAEATTNPVTTVARDVYKSLGDIIQEANPSARNLIAQQHDMITLGDFLGKQSGYARAGVRIAGVRVPVNVGSALEAAQSGLGTILGGATNAERIAPAVAQVGGQTLHDSLTQNEQQRTAQAGTDALSKTDLTSLDPNIASLVSQHMKSQQDNPTGLDPAKIQEAMVQDLKQTGGKNIAHLNTILSTVNKLSADNGLPSTAVTKVSEYQKSLGALQDLADAYKSSASGQELGQTLANTSKVLGNASGVTDKKSLAGLLPTPYDNGDVVAQKLAALKQMIDQNYSQQIQQAVDSQKNSAEQTSFLGSLLNSGSLAGASQ